MEKQTVCIVSYIRIDDAMSDQKELHAYQKRLAMWMLKQSFTDFFHTEFREDALGVTPYGKPYYKADRDCYFNISHCRGAVCVAVCHYPVGIDAESMRKVSLPAVKKCCSKSELQYVFADDDYDHPLSQDETERFLHLWTLKESFVKMTGEGIRMPLDTIDFACKVILEQKHPLAVLKCDEADSTSCLYADDGLILALSLKKGDIEVRREIIWQEYDKPAW